MNPLAFSKNFWCFAIRGDSRSDTVEVIAAISRNHRHDCIWGQTFVLRPVLDWYVHIINSFVIKLPELFIRFPSKVCSALRSFCTPLDALLVNNGLLCCFVWGMQYCKAYSALVRVLVLLTRPNFICTRRYDL